MNRSSGNESRLRVLFCLTVLALVAGLAILPYQFPSNARIQEKGLFQRTESHKEEMPNYDIRADKEAFEKIAQFRQSQKRSAAEVADVREYFVRGEERLKMRVPTLKVEYNTDIRTPEVIAPDVKKGRAFLTESASASVKRSEILRRFVKDNNELVGARDEQADELRVTADYTNPDGNLSFAHLEQFINDIPVFRGEIKAGFTKNGEMFRVINNLAPGLDYQSLSTDFRNPEEAVKAAARYINYELKPSDLRRNDAASDNLKVVFGEGDWATTAEKMYFPTEPGVAVPAWRVAIWLPVNAFYVIVDAETGTLLWRKNVTEDQTQAATYNVYVNPNAMINVADSPAPFTPGPIDPTGGTQGLIINRINTMRVGNEAPYNFNNLGWIADGNNTTDGNAVEAGLDLSSPNGIDPGTQATGNPNRVFSSNWNPPPGNPVPGDAHTSTEAQRGGVIQMFYIMNWYHDELYRLGFTEAARNYQHDNFGRGGLGNDRISAEGQDYIGINNANFSSMSDGSRGRMQMFTFTGSDPRRDAMADADIIIHEVTHGTSNRLHGNSTGLTQNMGRAMGEGWSDFYAHALLSEPGDPIDGVYTSGGYVLINGFNGAIGMQNYYYGIRRFPKAIMSSTGGPNNRPHNPLTFADIDSTQRNINDGAFPAMAGPHISNTADQVHAAGEVWSSALWEVRAKLIQRLGWEVGNRRALQYVTDGMKLAPLGPDFLQERDAIIAAAQASLPVPQANADVVDIWEGFRIRGMGFSASIQNTGTGVGDTRVTEAFDMPNLSQTPAIIVSDSTGDNDGFPEPGETLTLTVPLFNNTGVNATDITLQVAGGGSASYGTILNNSGASQNVSYTVPSEAACGSLVTITFNLNSSLGATSFKRQITVGVPVVLLTEKFDSVTAPALPVNWDSSVPNPPNPNGGQQWRTTTNMPASVPNAAYNPESATVSISDLESPAFTPTAANAQLKFDIKYLTEVNFDGAVLEIKIGNGNYQDILTAGGSFVTGGYNSTFSTVSDNPIEGRQAWTGDSGGYIPVLVNLPASAANQLVRIRWRTAADTTIVFDGVYIDNVQVINGYSCSFAPSVKSRSDFDGDGKTDLSVFRPSEGNWYLNRTNAGFTSVTFGLSSDILTPGDFDGDGKTDMAVYRGGSWFILKSSDSSFLGINWGAATDIPAAGDFDGDGKTDAAVFRPSQGSWIIFKSSNNGPLFIQFGQNGDIPVPGDYDGDGKTDTAVYRGGIWYILQSTAGFVGVAFGLGTDNPVQADYDGDNKDDIAVFRPSDGAWYRLNSSNGQFAGVQFGQNGDIPVPGDYDGDGKDDVAVYRLGSWFLLQSNNGFAAAGFGLGSDRPVPKAYIP